VVKQDNGNSVLVFRVLQSVLSLDDIHRSYKKTKQSFVKFHICLLLIISI